MAEKLYERGSMCEKGVERKELRDGKGREVGRMENRRGWKWKILFLPLLRCFFHL